MAHVSSTCFLIHWLCKQQRMQVASRLDVELNQSVNLKKEGFRKHKRLLAEIQFVEQFFLIQEKVYSQSGFCKQRFLTCQVSSDGNHTDASHEKSHSSFRTKTKNFFFFVGGAKLILMCVRR